MSFLWYPSNNHLPSFREAVASDPENYTLTVYKSEGDSLTALL